MPHGLDTEKEVFFYEQEFYPLSNFSAFSLIWKNHHFATSEQAYHWEKFPGNEILQREIQHAISAHEAFRIAQSNKELVRKDWESIKVEIMAAILRAKVKRHEYVRRKLLETGEREIIENSWRDDFWGWGPNKNGMNILGKLWMQIRVDIHSQINVPSHNVSDI